MLDLSNTIITNAAGLVKKPSEVDALLRAKVLTHITLGSITAEQFL